MFVPLKSSLEAQMEWYVEVGPLGGLPDDEMIVLRRRGRELRLASPLSLPSEDGVRRQPL